MRALEVLATIAMSCFGICLLLNGAFEWIDLVAINPSFILVMVLFLFGWIWSRPAIR